ncbi:IS3 family transposase [Elusimicrobiota bacterium]
MVREIRRKTKRKFSAEEKIRIVLEGLRGEESIAAICRRETIHPNLYYKWSKEFLESGKKRLTGDQKRQATTKEVSNLREENAQLKELVAELSLRNRVLKKNANGLESGGRMMRYSVSEKMEIIRIVENSNLPIKRTLKELDINRSTFYNWYRKYSKHGYDGLKDRCPGPRRIWNKIPEQEKQKVVEIALEYPEKTPRELAWHITDEQGYYISESSVYRILKSRNLITSPAYIVMSARDKFTDPTTSVNELWQTDFTYLKVIGWGWYYLGTVIDDYSRYIITWDLCHSMKTKDVKQIIEKAISATGAINVKVKHMPKLLSDNGSCYISEEMQDYLADNAIKHIRSAPFHPMTQGKIERYHRTMKNTVTLQNYYLPEELVREIDKFVDYYNNKRYHEAIRNMKPVDVYMGKDKEIENERRKTKIRTLLKRRVQNLAGVC